MKFLKIMLLISFVFIVSCNQDNDEIITQEKKINTLMLNQKNPNNTTSVTQNDLEKILQWVSFIAVQTIMSDTNAHSTLISKLNGNNSIPIQDLIGENVSKYDPFKSTFYNILSNLPKEDPIHGMQTPPRPIVRCSTCKNNEFIELFIKETLIDNCIELYFPEGLPSTVTGMTSTSHPLTTDNFNEGIKHYPDPFNNNSINTVIVNVNPAYLTNQFFNDIVVVARPYRPFTGQPDLFCSYNQYAGIDFTDFLQP